MKLNITSTSRLIYWMLTVRLSQQRQIIAYVLRKSKNWFPKIISDSTTFEGENIVGVKPPNLRGAWGAKELRAAITSHSRLVEVYSKPLQEPLTPFITEWRHCIPWYVSILKYYFMFVYFHCGRFGNYLENEQNSYLNLWIIFPMIIPVTSKDMQTRRTFSEIVQFSW